MSDGDAMWAGHMVSFAVLAQTVSLSDQLRRQDRRVEENDACWQVHHAALVDRFNGLAADYNALLNWANAVVAERDAAIARVAALEAQMAEERDKHAFELELAHDRSDRLDGQVETLLRLRRQG